VWFNWCNNSESVLNGQWILLNQFTGGLRRSGWRGQETDRLKIVVMALRNPEFPTTVVRNQTGDGDLGDQQAKGLRCQDA